MTLPDGETVECVQKGRSLHIACGDRVSIARMAGGGAIESVAPRTSLLYRSDAFREKLIAANVTQIVGVVAPGIGLDEELINRWMIAAESQGCRFVVAANKSRTVWTSARGTFAYPACIDGDACFVRGRGEATYREFTAADEAELHASFIRYARERFWDL